MTCHVNSQSASTNDSDREFVSLCLFHACTRTHVLTKVEIYQVNGNFPAKEFCVKKRYFDGNAHHAIANTKDLISFKVVSP